MASTCIALIAPSPAWAHAFDQRYDLPLPLWYYIAGGGAVVALSFLAIGATVRGAWARAPTLRVGLPARLVSLGERLGHWLAPSILVVLVAIGLFGEQGDWDSNLLPVAIWVAWWVGLAYICALIIDPWPVLDPWLAVGRWLERWRRRAPCRLPTALAAWPACALFLAFAWAELVWPDNAVPRKLAWLVIAYSLAAWTVMAVFGTEAWRRHCDPFGRFFGWFGRFAPLAIEHTADGGKVLVLKPHGAGLARVETPSLSEGCFVVLVLATVSFDGIGETPFWEAIVGESVAWLYAMGAVHALGYTSAHVLVKTLGLLLTPLIFAAIFLATCALAARLASGRAMEVARDHVVTLIPIAIAYHLAHYQFYLIIQGQMLGPLLSDPFNLGWDILGARAHVPDFASVDMRFIWLASVIAVVAGHVLAVLLGHQRAHERRGTPISGDQGVMTTLMVAYTMLSLWILAQPIVDVR